MLKELCCNELRGRLTKKYRERVRKAELAFNEVEKRARKENKLQKEDGKMWRMKKHQPVGWSL